MSAVTDKIDGVIATYLPTIINKQQTFLASRGVYFQGLVSSSAIPADGAAAVVDRWDAAPSYQGTTWRQVWGGAPPAMTSALRIDQYVSPAGPGWVLSVQVLQGGRLWQRSINHGPETFRDMPWTDVTASGAP